MSCTIRRADKNDAEVLYTMICELAEYEQALDEVSITLEQLGAGLCHQTRPFDAIVAEVNGVVVGFALCYKSFSTWTGDCYYLDDLYVKKAYRGHGIGKKLFDAVLDMAHVYGAARLEWIVLDWNTSAHEFYKKIGAAFLTSWVKCRLTLK